MEKSKPQIVPHLWFDTEAVEAAKFYTSIFPDSEIMNITTLRDTPSGDPQLVSIKLWGQRLAAINGGPNLKFNPSISFIVNFDPTRDKMAGEGLDNVWNQLCEGGTVLMPLDRYPFSERFGWVQDRYGLSWQLNLANPDSEERPTVWPSLMFVGDLCGKAEEAIQFYLSIFSNQR